MQNLPQGLDSGDSRGDVEDRCQTSAWCPSPRLESPLPGESGKVTPMDPPVAIYGTGTPQTARFPFHSKPTGLGDKSAVGNSICG